MSGGAVFRSDGRAGQRVDHDHPGIEQLCFRPDEASQVLSRRMFLLLPTGEGVRRLAQLFPFISTQSKYVEMRGL